MLSRASSDAGTRLRRSKSTSTVHTHRTPIVEVLDPDLAQKHAVAAAATAFVRAQQYDAAERAQKRNSEPSRSKSNASCKSQGSHFPPRESIERARQAQKPGVKGQALDIQCRQHAAPMPMPTTVEKFPPFHLTPSTGDTTSSQPSIPLNENMRPSSQPKLQRQSGSSSIASQQIRKARSMYYASSIQTGSPIARPPAKYLTTPPAVSPAPDSSLLSTNMDHFQRPRSKAVSPLVSSRATVKVRVHPNETVDKARDTYLQDFQSRQQRRLKQKPSLFLAPFKKRQDKEKEKARSMSQASGGAASFRTHRPLHTESTGDTVALDDFKPQKEKRSISDSLKHKFKKVFRRSSNKMTVLPAQQIEASREYFGDHHNTTSTGDEHYTMTNRNLTVPSPDEDILHRVRSRSPSLEGGRPAFARSNSRGSNRSLYSETASVSNAATSRVTSWSNSSAGGTLTQRDIKRLTVIHEAKDSIGSETERSAGFAYNSPKRKPQPISGFAAFRDPMPMDSLVEETSTPVDPKRVFSALMREIDGPKNVKTHPKILHQTSEGDSDVFVSSPIREWETYSSASKEFRSRLSASSDVQRPFSYCRPESASTYSKVESRKSTSLKSFGRVLKATIRTVTPPDPASSPVRDRATIVRDGVRLPRLQHKNESQSINSISKAGEENGREEDAALNSTKFKVKAHAHAQRSAGHGMSSSSVEKTSSIDYEGSENAVIKPTVKQIESRVQKAQERLKMALEEKHTPSLPRSARRTLTVTNFARKALPMVHKLGKDVVHEQGRPGPHQPRTSTSPVPEFENRAVMEEQKGSQHEVKSAEIFPTPAKPSRPTFSPLSPSIYSRNTDGISLQPNDSIISLDAAADNENTTPSSCETGSAVILASRAISRFVIGTPTPRRVSHSARSSRDWKSWLSHEVENLNLPEEEIWTMSESANVFSMPTRLSRDDEEPSTSVGAASAAARCHHRERMDIDCGGESECEESTIVHELKSSSPADEDVQRKVPRHIETPTNPDMISRCVKKRLSAGREDSANSRVRVKEMEDKEETQASNNDNTDVNPIPTSPSLPGHSNKKDRHIPATQTRHSRRLRHSKSSLTPSSPPIHTSRSRPSSVLSERMNDRFPYVNRRSNLRSSSHSISARLSRHTPSISDSYGAASGGSSLSSSTKSRVATSPKVCPYFSVPPTDKNKGKEKCKGGDEENLGVGIDGKKGWSGVAGDRESDKEKNYGNKRVVSKDWVNKEKENIMPTGESGRNSTRKKGEWEGAAPLSVTSASSVGRPRSLQPLSGTNLNRMNPTLAPHATTSGTSRPTIENDNVDTRSSNPHIHTGTGTISGRLNQIGDVSGNEGGYWTRINEGVEGMAMAPHIRLKVRPVSPRKLTPRPRAKSAFELRSLSSPPTSSTPPLHSRIEAPKAKNLNPLEVGTKEGVVNIESEPIKRRAPKGETSRLLLEESLGVRCTPAEVVGVEEMKVKGRFCVGDVEDGEKVAEGGDAEQGKSVLHVKASSSTLGRNKELSSGNGKRSIDTTLDPLSSTTPNTMSILSLKTPVSAKSPQRMGESSGSGVTGAYEARGVSSATPGHRMADRFLRERIVDRNRGRGSPVGSGGDVSSVTGSPAYA